MNLENLTIINETNEYENQEEIENFVKNEFKKLGFIEQEEVNGQILEHIKDYDAYLKICTSINDMFQALKKGEL